MACEASGKPPPDVAWIENGVLESSGKKATFLKFDNINRRDAGQYTCQANNSAEFTSIDTSIVVQCKYILTLLFYFWINPIYSANPVIGVSYPRTEKSVQRWQETEFHIKSFSALYSVIPIIGWGNWIYVESLLILCYSGGCDIFCQVIALAGLCLTQKMA